jgi:2,4-dienoyl-CoA reductase-like NADH-dependent reductase (Old Yellow Enzyme family)
VSSVDVSPLFSPYIVKGITLANRFVLPPMQRGMCRDGKPLPEYADYFEKRVRGGVSLVITEGCVVDHPSSSSQTSAGRVTSSAMEGWRQCISAVHRAGGSMLVQLMHEGARREETDSGPFAGIPSLSPSGLRKAGKPNGKAATAEDLRDIKEAFVRGAVAAKGSGADGVEVHACHGYLLDQFLWSETNRRSDGYGGDALEDRLRFPAAIVSAIRGAVGEDCVLSFRFSQWKEQDYEARIVQTPAELEVLLTTLRAAGVDLFHPSARRFFQPEWPGSNRGLAGWCKLFTDAPVITVGSVGLDVDTMDNFFGAEAQSTGEAGIGELVSRFRNGEFDLVAVGRVNIGDSHWVRKVREGRYSEIEPITREKLLDLNQELKPFD